MPFEIIGEHAQEHVGAHARAQPVENRTDVEVCSLEAAKGALDTGEALVGTHRIGGIDSLGWHTGAQHVEAVERGLFGNRGVIAIEGESYRLREARERAAQRSPAVVDGASKPKKK